MSSAPSVIVCGASERIGEGVIAGLKPEFQVVQFIMSPASGVAQIPSILRGEAPPSSDSDLGTHDYSQKVIAVVLGGAFTEEDAEQMMSAAKGSRGVPWLRHDASIPAPPVGPEYGKAIVARVKAKLGAMEKAGEFGEEKVFWY